MMKCFVTGAAGFIGSSLVDCLLQAGHSVVGYDNFSTGLSAFVDNAQKNTKFSLVKNDLLNTVALTDAIKNSDIVFHLAANADVRFGTHHPDRDLQQNTLATFNVLEAMRKNNIKKIVFSSTGSVYGEAKEFPTPENTAFPVQTSLYGTSKAAAEGLIQAYCEGFQFQAWIFRFVSILGERYTHGHVFDFYKQLILHPETLHVLGNGQQKKSYLYIQDCIDAILFAIEKSKDKINIFNLGTNEYCQVNDSIGWICEHLRLKPVLTYSGGERGWIGDNPFIFLDTQKICALGWKPKLSIKEGVIKTLEFLESNHWVFEERTTCGDIDECAIKQ